MFWGVILESGKRYSQKVSESYHLSMACLEALPGSIKPAKKEVYVMVEHGETEYILCVLEHGRVMQEKLDIIFDCGEVVTYFLNGEGVVHLTGYALAEPSEEAVDRPNDKAVLKLETNVADEDEDEEDEDWTPSKEQQKMDEDSSDDEYESEESKDESENDSEPELVKDEADQNQLNENAEESDDAQGNQKKLGAKVKSKKRKMNDTSPVQNGSIQDGEAKEAKHKKMKANHGDSEDYEDDSEAEESHDDDDDGIDEDDDSSMDASSLEDDDGRLSAAGRTPGPRKKTAKQMSHKNSLGQPPLLAQKQKLSEKVKLKKVQVSSTNKGTIPVTPKNAKKLTGNVQIEDLRVGKGPLAKNGKLVFFHYEGKFVSGKTFESCPSSEKPFSFRLGNGEVIKGLDIGLAGMNVGGKRKITIPPNMGYGSEGTDGIPPNTTLVFTVELKAVR